MPVLVDTVSVAFASLGPDDVGLPSSLVVWVHPVPLFRSSFLVYLFTNTFPEILRVARTEARHGTLDALWNRFRQCNRNDRNHHDDKSHTHR